MDIHKSTKQLLFDRHYSSSTLKITPSLCLVVTFLLEMPLPDGLFDSLKPIIFLNIIFPLLFLTKDAEKGRELSE